MSELSVEINAKDLILHLAGVSGELSQKTLSRLPWKESYREKCLYQLKQDGLIRKIERDELTGFRLTAKGKHYLVSTYPNRFTDLFACDNGVDKIRLEKASRLRAMRTSELLLSLYDFYADNDIIFYQLL